MKSRKQIHLDNIHFKKRKKQIIDLAAFDLRVKDEEKNASRATLFSKGRISKTFFTEDSKLYVTPKEQRLLEKGIKLNRDGQKWDSLTSRIVREYKIYRPAPIKNDLLERVLEEKYAKLNENLSQFSQNFLGQFSMARLWNMSIVGAILFGMFSMSMIYRYLGQGAAAGVLAQDGNIPAKNEIVLTQDQTLQSFGIVDEEAAILSDEEISQKDFENKVREMVKGYPIEKMLPYIFEKDRKTATFFIAIAKKESNWGVHSPVLDGQDCYNYLGYRGVRKLMGSGGHTCFNSRKDAVDTISKRISTLVNEQNLDTPSKMIVWKCGSSCAGHGSYDVQKWISDVDMYIKKMNTGEQK